MARCDDTNSASSQFYITLAKASFLDSQYAVFGKVIDGLSVVKALRVGDRMIEVHEDRYFSDRSPITHRKGSKGDTIDQRTVRKGAPAGTASMFCHRCEKVEGAQSKFCRTCGTKLNRPILPPGIYSNLDLVDLILGMIEEISEPLQQLIDINQEEENEEPISALDCIAFDISGLACYLWLKRGTISKPECEIFSDLDREIRGNTLGPSLYQKMIERLAEESPYNYQYPPMFVLPYLRGCDADHNTQHSYLYKSCLKSLLRSALRSPSARDQSLICEIETSWGEVTSAARAPNRCLNPESTNLIIDLNETVSSLLEPINQIKNRSRELFHTIRNVDQWLRFQLSIFVAGATLIDGRVDREELELLHDLSPSFGMIGERGTIRRWSELIENQTFQKPTTTELPFVIQIIDSFDTEHRTDHANRARALYFRLANCVLKAGSNL
jgi:hypothetical protein